jgi:hypothetical protein
MKSNWMLVGTVLLFCLITAYAQTTVANFTAKSANVSQAGTPLKINIIRWSTEQERLPLLAALNPALAPPPAAPAAAAEGGRGGGGRGGAAGAGGRGAGGGGRGGRGGGGDAAAAKPADPISNLTDAIGKAPTVGYIWTDEVVGYSIKYAFHMPSDGGERIILAADRRLGGFTNSWKPAGNATSTNYEFTVVELRFDAKGAGEGKTSLTTKVVLDEAAKSLVLENYSGTPVMLTGVKK